MCALVCVCACVCVCVRACVCVCLRYPNAFARQCPLFPVCRREDVAPVATSQKTSMGHLTDVLSSVRATLVTTGADRVEKNLIGGAESNGWCRI
jgi:hypothetical protein